VQSGDRQILRPTVPDKNDIGSNRDLLMCRIGTDADGDDEAGFGSGEMNSVGDECLALVETGLGDTTSSVLSR